MISVRVGRKVRLGPISSDKNLDIKVKLQKTKQTILLVPENQLS